MTHDEIRAAVAASQDLRDLIPTPPALAEALSTDRVEIFSRMTSARGIAELVPGGPLAAEVILLKLEGAATTMLASQDQQQKVLGSLLHRQLGFLAGDGLDFGSPALRGMLDQFEAMGILTANEVSGLKSIAERDANISEYEVRCALYADDGTLRV